jgi:phosphoribosylformimino-5-aminoimidazole carboxamide ribotide isomerase
MAAEGRQGRGDRGGVKGAEGQGAAFQVIPAVDLLGGQAVRLEQGDFARVIVRAGDPAALVRRFAALGPPLLHLVDLAASRDGRPRPDVVRALVAEAGSVPVQAAGGIRSPVDALTLVEAGVARVVVGTAAFERPRALAPYLAALGERLVVAVDVRDGLVARSGWEGSTGVPVDEAVDLCVEAGVRRLLCTAIERDGTMAGPDLELLDRVRTRSRLPVLAAGGIGSDADLRALAAVGLEGAIVGRALLEGTVELPARALGSE